MNSAFQSWQDFLHMGGYGFYVWLAVALTVFSLLMLTFHTWWKRRRLLLEIRRQQARERRIFASRQKAHKETLR